MKDSYGTKPTACLALSDGTVFYGEGFGSTGRKTAELCFNTSMTGYQEILTDPSYAGQIVTFTFPHIGNVGVNLEDNEANMPFASGMVVKWRPTLASNWRSQQNLIEWLIISVHILFHLKLHFLLQSIQNESTIVMA